jgi:hypothetical protein
MKEPNEIVLYCSKCDKPIRRSMLDGIQVDENRVYKLGKLAYIELFHSDCISKE